MRKAGMTALVLEAKMSVLLEEDEVISRANRAQISILMPASIDELC
jgi:DUF1009 family protein